jgi:hypothetical protein
LVGANEQALVIIFGNDCCLWAAFAASVAAHHPIRLKAALYQLPAPFLKKSP